MKEKFLVRLYVPTIDMIYNVYLPINSRISNDILLLCKAIVEMSNGEFVPTKMCRLYDRDNGSMYHPDSILRDTNIRNGSGIVLL